MVIEPVRVHDYPRFSFNGARLADVPEHDAIIFTTKTGNPTMFFDRATWTRCRNRDRLHQGCSSIGA